MNRCEEAGFEHSWEDNNREILSICPSPEKKDTCKNCWLIKFYRYESREWIEYSDWKERTWGLSKAISSMLD